MLIINHQKFSKFDKKICRSFCENERRVCRTLKSAFGPNEYIRDACSVDPWVDGAGPSETCTGAGSNVYVSNVRWLAACICFVHALFLAMLSNQLMRAFIGELPKDSDGLMYAHQKKFFCDEFVMQHHHDYQLLYCTTASTCTTIVLLSI